MKSLSSSLKLKLLFIACCLLVLSACKGPPRTGPITVVSWPEGDVYVDGQPTGKRTPCYVRLTYAEQKHVISVRAGDATIGEETVARTYYTYLGDTLFDESGWVGFVSGHSPLFLVILAASPLFYPLYLVDRKRWPWWEPRRLQFGDVFPHHSELHHKLWQKEGWPPGNKW